MEEKPSLIFMGTPEFAVPSLKVLNESGAYDIRAVVTQPDKPSGRGQKLTPPPVKRIALELGLKVFQPSSIKKIQLESEAPLTQTRRLLGTEKNQDLVDYLNTLTKLDAVVAVAYGKIIPASLLRFPQRGIVNLHPSLLPRWRGAAPIQRCLFSGDTETGVTLMQVDEGLDSGPIFSARKMPVRPEDTFGTLHNNLAETGALLLRDCLPSILDGSAKVMPQGEDAATYADKWEKKDCIIDWEEGAEVTLRRIRACSPTPGAQSLLEGSVVKIFSAASVPDKNYRRSPAGTIVDVNRAEIIVSSSISEYIKIEEMQFPGKKRLPVADILRGRRLQSGMRFE